MLTDAAKVVYSFKDNIPLREKSRTSYTYNTVRKCKWKVLTNQKSSTQKEGSGIVRTPTHSF